MFLTAAHSLSGHKPRLHRQHDDDLWAQGLVLLSQNFETLLRHLCCKMYGAHLRHSTSEKALRNKAPGLQQPVLFESLCPERYLQSGARAIRGKPVCILSFLAAARLQAVLQKQLDMRPPSTFEAPWQAGSRSTLRLESLSEWRMSNFFGNFCLRPSPWACQKHWQRMRSTRKIWKYYHSTSRAHIEVLQNLIVRQPPDSIVCCRGHRLPVWDVACCPVGHYFASASNDRTVRIWCTDRVHAVRMLPGRCSECLPAMHQTA